MSSQPVLRKVLFRSAVMAVTAVLAAGCAQVPAPDPEPLPPTGAEARSLLGAELHAPPLADDVRAERLARLAEARRTYEADPTDLDAIIWYGRRTAYLGRYRDAIAIFSGGLRLHPEAPELYRHRGHRFITLRRFDNAIWDLERASRLTEGKEDRIEEDGLPNARNQPTSTLQSNIWYHLGLAYFVTGDFESALEAYRECLKVSRNPDMLTATTHWIYMTLRRLGRDEEAKLLLGPINASMDIIENHGYHRLVLMYKGEIDPDTLLAEVQSDSGSIESASVAFGIANWLMVEDDSERARALLEAIVANPQWAAFGVIAAEADLARMGPKETEE